MTQRGTLMGEFWTSLSVLAPLLQFSQSDDSPRFPTEAYWAKAVDVGGDVDRRFQIILRLQMQWRVASEVAVGFRRGPATESFCCSKLLQSRCFLRHGSDGPSSRNQRGSNSGESRLCGRFTLRTNFSVWSQQFLPQFDPGSSENVDFPPRFNVAPTQSIPCVFRETAGDDRKVSTFRWGLVPSWAKELAIGNRMINARGETVDSKPSFRRAFAQRRCVIPADGYFEWKKVSDGKQPYLMELRSKGVFAMAGLWEENHKVSEDGSPVRTCTIITTSANQVTSEVHDRMPVILEQADVERWLDPGFRDTDKLKELLQPAPDAMFGLTAVSRRVNSPRNDDPECVEPID